MPKYEIGISISCSYGCKQYDIYDTRDMYTDEEWSELTEEQQEEWKSDMMENIQDNYLNCWSKLIEE